MNKTAAKDATAVVALIVLGICAIGALVYGIVWIGHQSPALMVVVIIAVLLFILWLSLYNDFKRKGDMRGGGGGGVF
jgi:Flp pilus assembly protein TadB